MLIVFQKQDYKGSSDEVIDLILQNTIERIVENLGLTATRSIGEASIIYDKYECHRLRPRRRRSDDFESYGLTLALDTSLGNQNLSPYLMLSKTDYQDDADSFSLLYGMGGYFLQGTVIHLVTVILFPTLKIIKIQLIQLQMTQTQLVIAIPLDMTL